MSLTSVEVSPAAAPDAVKGPTIEEQNRTNARNKAILAWATEQYSMCKNQRSSVERQWYLNLAMYAGKQNVAIINTESAANGFKLYTPKAPPWRVRLVINRIRGIIRTELAKVTATRPRFTVVPKTSEDEDRTAARISEQIFDVIYTEKDMKHVLRRAEWWTLICGTGFIKHYWNPGGKDDEGNPGDIDIDPVTPFHIFVPDLLEQELENQPYIIHATVKSQDWAKNAFPAIRHSNLTGSVSASDILEDSFLGVTGGRSNNKNNVVVLEFWIKPGNPLLPQGGLVTIIGDQLVQVKEEYPYIHGEFPFSKLEHVETGRFYTESIVTDLIPIQKEYNRTRSQIIESKNLMGRPKLLAAQGSVNANQITSEPGQVVFYQVGFERPTPLPMDSLPSYVLNEVHQLQQDMDDMAGQHEISRGQNPTQVTAATALAFLKEQDDTKLSGTVESIESALEKVGRHTLHYVTQFWTVERLVRIVGEDQKFDAQRYSSKSIKGNHDVRVESGSALPQSKAAKQAFVMDLMKMGAIPQEKALQMLEIGGIEKIYEEYLIDVRQAQRENQKMLDGGEPIMPNDYDNHEVHIQIHNKFRKGQEFEALDDEHKQIFHMHVQGHQMALMGGLQPGGLVAPPADPNDPNAQGNAGAPPQDPSQLPQGAPPPSMGVPQ